MRSPASLGHYSVEHAKAAEGYRPSAKEFAPAIASARKKLKTRGPKPSAWAGAEVFRAQSHK
ncbi:hypothetical protein B1812_07575 [Methylocystis bryophila]|uniref:Uncharacterized protein n=1 Tax=Methylocystis bryophila TaxID=655015 RepID=A0A1W6MTW0_9HYPH|nr:hypothetical protein B1812_07575 [Methylocystis bryophila]